MVHFPNPPNPETQIPQYKFKWSQGLNLNLYRETPRNLSFSIWWVSGVMHSQWKLLYDRTDVSLHASQHIWMSQVRDMTHLYVRCLGHEICFIWMHRSTNERVIFVTWLIYMCDDRDMCHMTWLMFHLNASQHIWRSSWHDSFICVMFVTWLIYVWCSWNCHMTWLMFHWNASQHIWRSDSFIFVFVTWLIYMCDVRDMSYDMTHVSFECVAAHMKESCSWHDSFICVMIVTWLMIFTTHSYVWYSWHDWWYSWHDSCFIWMHRSTYEGVRFVTWLIYMCDDRDMTYDIRDTFICDMTHLYSCVTFLIHMCDMTHSLAAYR